ncbi:hypothetical protein B0H14DRAFT_3494288 [Mycena olivaceomarginata]|nr:hypothetical protein B0H14DRAFT_3494288 [Mycena olivaceomarginata]
MRPGASAVLLLVPVPHLPHVRLTSRPPRLSVLPPSHYHARPDQAPRVPENRSGNATTRTIGRLRACEHPMASLVDRLWIDCYADEYQRASPPELCLVRQMLQLPRAHQTRLVRCTSESGARGHPPPLPLETSSGRSSHSSQARKGEAREEAPPGMTIIGNDNIAHENGCAQLWVWARLVSAPTPSSPAHDTAKKHLSASALPPIPRSRGRCAYRPLSAASGHTRWDVQYLVSLPFSRAAQWVVVAVERGGRGEGE